MTSALFLVSWLLIVLVALVVDFVGNNQRGRFRPIGTRAQGRRERRALQRRHEAERRAALAAAHRAFPRQSRLRRRPAPIRIETIPLRDEQFVEALLGTVPPAYLDAPPGADSVPFSGTDAA